MGIPLSVARGVRLPGEAWSARDWALAQAVEMLDRARCPGCGQPTWLSHDKATRGKWSVKAERCFACDAADQRRDDMAKGEPQRPSAIHFTTRFVG